MYKTRLFACVASLILAIAVLIPGNARAQNRLKAKNAPAKTTSTERVAAKINRLAVKVELGAGARVENPNAFALLIKGIASELRAQHGYTEFHCDGRRDITAVVTLTPRYETVREKLGDRGGMQKVRVQVGFTAEAILWLYDAQTGKSRDIASFYRPRVHTQAFFIQNRDTKGSDPKRFLATL